MIVFASNVSVGGDSPTIRPFKVAPVFIALTPLSANIFPLNAVVVSSVTELPTLHKTLQASPPVIDEPGDVIRVDTVLKIWTPFPVSYRFPLSEKLLVEQYTPGPTPDGKVAVKSTAPKVWSQV